MIDITISFMFCVFLVLKVYELIFIFAFFQFYPVVSRNGKVHHPVLLFSFCVFLILTLASGLSLKFEWQQA